MEVVRLRWPSERSRRERLRRQGTPRLLLVDDAVPPPVPDDCLEEWARVSAGDAEITARVEALLLRWRSHVEITPELDAGVLRVGDALVSLSPLESRLAAVLLERRGRVVPRDVLVGAAWPDGPGLRNTLDVHIARLRRRLASVGLALRTVRSRGYLLEPSGCVQQGVREA
ncbi:MAG: helix-turn-helix domain-containing protein [Actinobacteria bacterium]|nr:helix-turn-helix domain-containing protein [Actinomycetota bacterium]